MVIDNLEHVLCVLFVVTQALRGGLPGRHLHLRLPVDRIGGLATVSGRNALLERVVYTGFWIRL